MLCIAVVDARGGGLGASIVKKLHEQYAGRVHILALGTNAAAASAMQKSGADGFAVGESAICTHVKNADIIMGGIGIIAASGMLGEITFKIARAIAESRAQKILIPISKCNLQIAGAGQMPAKELIDQAVVAVSSLLQG